jgi:hypothetical protein
VNVSINIIVAIAGICLIDLCYIFVIHTQQDATQRNKTESMCFHQKLKNIYTVFVLGLLYLGMKSRGSRIVRIFIISLQPGIVGVMK